MHEELITRTTAYPRPAPRNRQLFIYKSR